MAKNKYKIGEIVFCYPETKTNHFFKWELGSNNDVVYAIIVSIVCNGENFKEYDIITGEGDDNSDVLIGLKVLTPEYKIEDEIIYLNPHNINKSRLDNSISEREKQLETLIKIRNLGQNYLRENKLKRILR